MTRNDAEALAATFKTALLAAELEPDLGPGLRMAALLVAKQVEAEGRMSAVAFLGEVGMRVRPRRPRRGPGTGIDWKPGTRPADG